MQSMSQRNHNRVILLLLAAASLSACTNRNEALDQFLAATKKETGGDVAPLPEVKPYQGFIYAAQSQRSPFLPGVPGGMRAGGGPSVRPDSKRNREFLEQYSLDTLRMVGTLKLGGKEFGLIKTKEGLVHRVLPGNYIGQNEGKVLAVSGAKITLVEIVPDGLGGYTERPAALALNE